MTPALSPNDSRGNVEVLAAVLLIGVVVLGIAAVLLVGAPHLADEQTGIEISQAEQSITQFSADARRVASGSTAEQQIDLGFYANAGTIDVDGEEGHISVRYVDDLTDQSRVEIVNTSLGTMTYKQGDTTVGYQGGGVWRSDGAHSTMVSPPQLSFQDGTFTMPVIRTGGDGSIHSDLSIGSSESPVQRFPDDTGDYHNVTNRVDQGTLWITIDSRYYRAWGAFFDAETEATVIYPREGRMMAVLFGSQMRFSPDSGIIATSGPGEIRVEGEGSYIDSYNSSIGPYTETQDSNGTVKSAGDVRMRGGSWIAGDVDSNRLVDLGGSAQIYGNVSAVDGWITDGDSSIHGDKDYDANVPILPPLDSLIELKRDAIAETNDNNLTDLIKDDDTLNHTAINQGQELPPGEYYLEDIRLEDGETLRLGADAGNITIVVENYVVLNEGRIEIRGENDDGTVRMYIASESSSGETIPGTGGEPADHFFVNQDSQIVVNNDASPRFQVLAPAHFTGGIRASGSKDAAVTGAIIAPTPGAGPGQFIVRDGKLFGTVVTGNFSAENNAQVHFDHAFLSESVPFGEGVDLLEYLYITEYAIEVKGNR